MKFDYDHVYAYIDNFSVQIRLGNLNVTYCVSRSRSMSRSFEFKLDKISKYVGISYCKTGNFNYTNFRVYVQVNINHPAGHLLPRPVNHGHYHVIMSMLVIVLFFVLRLVLSLGE